MSLNHLKRQLRELKRQARFGEPEAEAAQKRQEARLEKCDLDIDLDYYEIQWDIKRLEGGSPEEQDRSDSQPSQKELERHEYLLVSNRSTQSLWRSGP